MVEAYNYGFHQEFHEKQEEELKLTVRALDSTSKEVATLRNALNLLADVVELLKK
jgi:hypothetical protein